MVVEVQSNYQSQGYASVWSRLVAMLIDSLILIVPCVMAAHILPILGGLIVLFLYAPVLESSEIRGTLGKYWMGIQVTDLKGDQLTFKAAFVRCLIELCSSMLLFLGHFLIFFTDRRQALHDMIAETVVVKGHTQRSVFDVWIKKLKELVGSIPDVKIKHYDSLAQLERLHQLREKGIITEEEFLEQKRKILK